MKINQKYLFIVIDIILLFTSFPVLCKNLPKKSDNRQSCAEEKWFKTKLVAEKVWRIDDHGGDNIYLIVGDEKALLIDTGLGVADLAACVSDITNLPLLVVNTHGHPDHAGGNFQFPEIYAHPADFKLVEQFSSKNDHDGMVRSMIENNPGFEAIFLKDIDDYKMPEIKPVTAGYVFDLGNRKIEVIETPGHTKGSIVLLDAENKLLFTGDNDNTLVWLFLDGCLPIESYLQTLQRLNQRSDEFDNIFPGHGDVIDKSFINEQIICAKNIISRECQGEKYESFAGSALLCKYKRAGIAYNPENIFIKC